MRQTNVEASFLIRVTCICTGTSAGLIMRQINAQASFLIHVTCTCTGTSAGLIIRQINLEIFSPDLPLSVRIRHEDIVNSTTSGVSCE